MSFEVLFLGLVMVCTDAEMCGFTADDYGARAVLPNATESGLHCNDGGCKGCDQTGMRHPRHYPSILFLADQAEGEDASTCTGKFCCIQPAGPYSFEVVNGKEMSSLEGSLSTVPEVHEFEDRLTDLHSNIFADRERAIAWFDLADTGEVSTMLESPSSWRAHPPRPLDNPAFGDLAEAIHWQATQGTLELKMSSGDTIRFHPEARVAVLNSPVWGRGRGGGSPLLDHYQLFYRLLDGGLSNQKKCRRPTFAGVGNYAVVAYDAVRWVDGGDLKGERTHDIPDACQLGQTKSAARGSTHLPSDAALCPPSKFP